MNIRPAITTDIALLQAIGKLTFYETFADTHTFVLGSDAQTDILMKLSMF